MTTRDAIEVAGTPIEVVRKDIKNLHIGVYPPDGRVRVAAPLWLDQGAIRLAVISRLGWIRRRQAEFDRQERQSLREFVTGESHYFQGRRYRLNVVEADAPQSVRILNNTRIEISVRPGSSRERREATLHRWYRERLRERLPSLLEKWQPIVGERVAEIRIRRMKTLWGSCNADARRVWLNLELAKKPATCLEYILVHEMVHLKERSHGDRFSGLMSRAMPNWRTLRDELNRAPLAHADWLY